MTETKQAEMPSKEVSKGVSFSRFEWELMLGSLIDATARINKSELPSMVCEQLCMPYYEVAAKINEMLKEKE